MNQPIEYDTNTSPDVAIIGFSGRFPGASDPETFWLNLIAGRESVTRFPENELHGIDRHLLDDKNYVKASPVLDQPEYFDANFFGFSRREAYTMDPQHRLFMECAWKALEHAGYNPDAYDGSIGVYAGAAMNTYLLFTGLLPRFSSHYLSTLIGADKDFMATKTSYKLNLRGPSITVQTACSTSLVAVHMACQSLLSEECDMALAGGSSVKVPHRAGYLYEEGNVFSPDGHCRPFDANAQGTVFGSGVGTVLLKKLKDAIADGDHVFAVIKGSAINNDGASKVDYTAPSVESHAHVVAEAQANAGVTADNVTYLEAHGTGTYLGDPIEIAALTKAFRLHTKRNQYCAIGSVKGNVGHLDSAAGITSLIKTTLALHHSTLPPSINFERPNPEIDFQNSPFYVNTEVAEWKSDSPKTAGVSSLGIGGTNCHVILQEAPLRASTINSRSSQLLLLSARTAEALEAATQNLANHLQENGSTNLADVAYTLHVGRKPFEYRRMLVCADTNTAAETLSQRDAVTGAQDYPSSDIAFLFSGQGSQYPHMANGLYAEERAFRDTVDYCSDILEPVLGSDLRKIIYPHKADSNAEALTQTSVSQPALFVVEFALAKLWQEWGIQPTALAGHSIGEYVAATLAGVFTLEDALNLVARRGQLMQQMPTGAMLSVALPEPDIQSLLDDAFSIAVINGPARCVISGPDADIQKLADTLKQKGVASTRLHTSHAFHSSMMEPAAEQFLAAVKDVTLRRPKLRFLSNKTGTWIRDEEATDPNYWAQHIRATVRFSDNLRELFRSSCGIFLEVGPGNALATFARQHPEKSGAHVVFSSVRHVKEKQSDTAFILNTLGRFWLAGVSIDWDGFYQDEQRLRVPLPTYPFQRERYWFESEDTKGVATSEPAPVLAQFVTGHKPETLTEWLSSSGHFSPTEQALLPRIAGLLISAAASQPLTTDSLNESWLTETVWETRPSKPLVIPADFVPSLAQLSQEAGKSLAKRMAGSELNEYGQIHRELESLSISYITEAFETLGFDSRKGQRHSTAALVSRLGIHNKQRRLFSRLLEILDQAGVLENSSGDWLCIGTTDLPEAKSKWHKLLARFPIAESELALLHRCGAHLAGILNGTSDPLELLFPEGDLVSATRFYQDSPVFRTLNELVQETISRIVSCLPEGRVCRILEIGAGTGGTTARLLPQLPSRQTEYVFSDVSQLFLDRAAERFSQYNFVSYESLDIGQPPAAQGFDLHQFDIVIASNVLHATEDVRRTLTHVRQLLAPQGVLLLFESVEISRWLDLLVGGLEGWWLFQDADLRPDHALLSIESWRSVLETCGFKDFAAIDPKTIDEVGLLGQAILIASAGDSPSDPPSVLPKTSLVFADREDNWQCLECTPQESNRNIIVVRAGRQYEQVSQNEFRIDPADDSHYDRLCQDVDIESLEQIFHFWSLDIPPAERVQATDFDKSILRVSESAFYLTQAILDLQMTTPPALWWVTRDAVMAIEGDRLTGVSQAGVWGIGKCLVLEHPELGGGLIDLPTKADQTTGQVIWSHVNDPRDEDQVAIREQQKLVARLKHIPKEVSSPLVNGDATYLITGGLGFLGAELAGWLVENGARHIVLTSRRSVAEIQADQQTDSKLSHATQIIRSLRAQGASISVRQTDAGDFEQTEQLINEITNGQNPLRGVFHTAGVWSHKPILSVSRNDISSMMHAKAKGAWNLNRLTQHLKLDYFVCFSSAVSTWGAQDVAHYAGANAILDALAGYRQRQNLPALTVNWGLFPKGSMVSDQMHEFCERIGWREMSTSAAFSRMASLLDTSRVHATVSHMDWPSFRDIFEARGPRPLLETLSTRNSVDERHATQAEEPLESTSPDSLLDSVGQQTAEALGIPLSQINVQVALIDLGLDSLMAVSLRNRIKKHLKVMVPQHRFLDGASITDIADFVEKESASASKPESLPARRKSMGMLSFAQERLWFLSQMTPDTPIYNIPSLHRVSGYLDIKALHRSLERIVERHEILRATFPATDGQANVMISPNTQISLSFEDIRNRPAANRESEAMQRAAQTAKTPLDISAGPLLVSQVWQLSDKEFLLLVIMHHMVSDGWSVGVFFKELSAFYEQETSGKKTSLPSLPMQFIEFAAWERQWVADEVLNTQLAYWKQKLAKPIPVLELPTDYPRPSAQTYRGTRYPISIPKRLATALKTLSLQESATLFTVLLASFKTLLYRYTGQTDLLVGTPIAHRHRSEIEPMIGCFINTLVLRTQFSDDITFRQLLHRVQETCTDAYSHPDIPFEKLVEELNPERVTSRSPLFQAVMVLKVQDRDEVTQLGSVQISPESIHYGASQFDLTLYVNDIAHEIEGWFEYCSDLFTHETIQRMASHLQTLLEDAVVNPDCLISELQFLTKDERAQFVPLVPPKVEQQLQCIHARFEAQARMTPGAVAAVYEDQLLTYEQLDSKANRLANHLRSLGVGPESLVGLFVERSLDMVVGALAILKSGGAYLPVDPGCPAERLAFMLDDSKVELALTHSNLQAKIVDQDVRVLCLDGSEDVYSFDDSKPPSEVAIGNLAYVIYTSGSTGHPKGVEVTHHNVARLFTSTDQWFQFNESDVWTLFHSIAFDFSVWELWGALLYGGRLVVVPSIVAKSPDEFVALLTKEQITVLNLTPSAFRQTMAAEEKVNGESNLALRYITFGGEALELQSLKPWFDRHGEDAPQLINMYGITETTVHVTFRRIQLADVQANSGSVIGVPIPDLQVYLLNKHQQPVPVGVVGEVYVGGAGVARGYVNRPELTAERFIQHPFTDVPNRLYRSGDLARYLPNGDLEYLGRIDHQVKIRGFRIELGEIESSLAQLPEVRDVTVTPHGSVADEQKLVAYIVPTTAEPLPTNGLRNALRKQLPDYMVPSAFVSLKSIPLTPNGKVDKKALPDPSEKRLATAEFVAPRNDEEEMLAECWKDILTVKDVGVHDNFFELGGHSLMAMQIVSQINANLGVALPVRELFESPTIAQLVESIERAKNLGAQDSPTLIKRAARDSYRI